MSQQADISFCSLLWPGSSMTVGRRLLCKFLTPYFILAIRTFYFLVPDEFKGSIRGAKFAKMYVRIAVELFFACLFAKSREYSDSRLRLDYAMKARKRSWSRLFSVFQYTLFIRSHFRFLIWLCPFRLDTTDSFNFIIYGSS